MKNCADCVNALLEDQGYSNYTVEGTDFTCKLGIHPDGTFDRWYKTEPKLLFAEKCASYEEGVAESHCVECPYDCQCEGTKYARSNNYK